MSDLTTRLTDALAGRYRIERQIGEGGMAIVYLAEDSRHHRKVAVKVLRPELGVALGADRFLREIEIAAGLRHPHILPLYDSGEAERLLYYVMPLIEGESLRTLLARDRQLPIGEALRYAREVADALSYAHAHGVVHRDIKPENILIESGHVVVADFGIAKAVSAANQSAALTATGMSIGTPAYISPEQAAGDRDVDGRSDLYSLGCVLYEMLAGQPPFSGVNTESLVRQHVMTSPPPVTQFRPAVPPSVSDALMRALAKAPADRFNPVGQFSAALDHAPDRIHTAPSASRKARARWPVAAAVLGAFVALMVWTVSRRGPAVIDAAASRSIAVVPFENLGGDSSVVPLILGMHAEMVTQLTKLGGLTVASRSSALEYRDSRKTDRQIASELGVASLLKGSVQRAGDQVRFSVALTDAPNGKELWAESYDRQYTAANLFEVQGDIARQVAAALRVQLTDRQQEQISVAPTTNLQALDLYHRALVLNEFRTPVNETLTVRVVEQAVALDPRFVAAWSLLAQSRAWLLRQSLVTDTLPAWLAVQRTQELAPGSLEAILAHAYYRYFAQGDFAGALRDLEAADRLMPNSSEILQAMGLQQRRLGRWEESVATLKRAAQLDPRNALIPQLIGENYAWMRRMDEAERAFDQSIALAPAGGMNVARKTHLLLMTVGDTMRARAFAEASMSLIPARFGTMFAGRIAFVARDYPRAMSIFRTLDSAFIGGGVMQRDLALALTAFAAGDTALARAHADTTLQRGRVELALRRRRGPHDPFGQQSLVEGQMAVALALRGERDAAQRLAQSASRHGLEADGLEGGNTLRLMAITHMLTGRKADAVTVLAKLLSVPSTMAVAELRLDPTYDGLRSEPGFQRLVAR